MGWFKKESSTHFERDAEGRVVKVTYSGDQLKDRPFDALMEQYYREHPEERRSAKLKAGAVKLGKKLDDWSRNYNKKAKSSGPMFTWNPPKKSSGGGRPPMAMEFFNLGGTSSRVSSRKKKSSGRKKYTVIGGKAYPIAGMGKKKKTSGKKRRGYNPDDPFDFPDWGGW